MTKTLLVCVQMDVYQMYSFVVAAKFDLSCTGFLRQMSNKLLSGFICAFFLIPPVHSEQEGYSGHCSMLVANLRLTQTLQR